MRIANIGKSVDNACGMIMSKYVLSLLMLCLVMSPAASVCQMKSYDPQTTQICAVAQKVELPAGDRPGAGEIKALDGCNSQDLYFGLDTQEDAVKARKCAYLEMDQGDLDLKIRGRGLLTMVYANGKGAARNLDVALRFACEMPGARQDIAGSVRALDRLKGMGAAGVGFGICDHSSGDILYRACANLEDRFDSVKREEKLQAVIANWPAQDKGAFEDLRQKAKAFFKSRASKEIDLRYTVEVHEIGLLEDEFIEKLKQLESGELPKYTHEQSVADEAQLSARMSQIDRMKDDPTGGNVTQEGFKSTQRLWIAYRGAWKEFGGKKYPKVSADSWNAWLAEDRLAMMLRSLPSDTPEQAVRQ
jgi:hypothetical protein